MKQSLYTVMENKMLAQDVWRMVLSGDTSAITAPGQFINIQLAGHFLRRPISICDWDEKTITIIYKVLGRGTKEMTAMGVGTVLDILTGLGNGFDTSLCGDKTLLIGGGVGVPPMYGTAKQLLAEGKHPITVLGFNSKADVFYEEEFRALGVETRIVTVDGSYGQKGFVSEALGEDYDFFCACGPVAMLKAVSDASTTTSGLLSFEERMGCGFGACVGCTCQTKYGNKRICKDGPVLTKEEVVW